MLKSKDLTLVDVLVDDQDLTLVDDPHNFMSIVSPPNDATNRAANNQMI